MRRLSERARSPRVQTQRAEGCAVLRARPAVPQCGPLVLALALALPAIGCSFSEAAADLSTIEENVCFEDAQCGTDSICMDGMCVVLDAPPLTLTLEVTPARDARSSDALPVLLEPVRITGPAKRTFLVGAPVRVSGDIRLEGEPIEAEVRFHPITTVAGLPARVVSVMAPATAEGSGGNDYEVLLSAGKDYRMTVLPADTSLPPYRKLLSITGKRTVDVDYDELELREQTFAFEGMPEGRLLVVRARHSTRGEVLSSSATLDSSGRVTLLFSGEAEPYRLELRPEQDYGETLRPESGASECEALTADYPTLNIEAADIAMGQVGIPEVRIPSVASAIQYEGSVELCDGALSGAAGVGNLPLTLRSSELVHEREETALIPSFSTTAMATSTDGGPLRFCTQVIPGSYEIVVTPPAGMECGIFAEQRLVQAPDGLPAKGALLALPQASYLQGTLRTDSQEPVPGASIEVKALGRSQAVQFAETDRSITQYNRSKQGTSDEEGMFEIPVDVGVYDVIVKPPSESGFPWQVRHDVTIGNRGQVGDAMGGGNHALIDIRPPIVVEGQLEFDGGDRVLAGNLGGAEIRAFMLVADESSGGTRAVAVGRTVADEAGTFSLLLAPNARNGWGL